MNSKKASKSLRPEVGIPSKTSWNPTDLRVPRFYAFDVGKLARRLLLCGLLAAVLYGLTTHVLH